MNPTKSDLPALTGLRMLAAAAVYLSHIPQPAMINARVSAFMSAGYNGVTLFFVLSGFVLGLNYFDQLASPSPSGLWNYAVARVARVYPLYVLVLLFAVLMRSNAHQAMDGIGLHFAGLQAWSPSLAIAFGFNSPAWSISVELFLYLCFPVIVVVLARVARRPVVIGTLLVLVVAAVFLATAWFVSTGRADLPSTDGASAHRWLYRTPATRLGDFVAGILLSRVYLMLNKRGSERLGRALVGMAGLATIALMSAPSHLQTAWSLDASYLIPSLVLILGAAMWGVRGWLASRAMVIAGEASFAFYLIHTQIMFRLGAGSWPHGATVGAIVSHAFVFLVVLAAAICLHFAIERPARAWVRQLLSLPKSTKSVGRVSP